MNTSQWRIEINFPQHGKPMWRELGSGIRFATEEEAAVYATEYEKVAKEQGVEVDTRLREQR